MNSSILQDLAELIPPEMHTFAQRKAHAARLRAEIEVVAAAGSALDLRVARLVAWFKHQDLAPLGFGDFEAFRDAYVDWKSSWLGDLIRLVEADLPLVKAAVCQQLLPLSKAVRAPRETNFEDEADWLALALGNRLPRPPDPGPEYSFRVGWYCDDATTIHEARERARLILGRRVPNELADAFVRKCWRQLVNGHEIIATAQQPPPPPDQSPLPAWEDHDPATALIGPYETPGDLREGLAMLQTAQLARRDRVLRLGRLYRTIRDEGWVWQMGFDSHAHMARCLGISLRALQRHARLADNLALFPELADACRQGMALSRLEAIADIVDEDTVARWVAIAWNTPARELARAVRWAESRDVEVEEVLDQYEAAMGKATNPVVVDRSRREPAAPKTVRAHPDQLDASRWFLDHIVVPPRRGIGKVVDDHDHQCLNPRCEYRGLRIHVHHILFRINGGSDDEENLIPLCIACHLRVVHPGHATVERRGDVIVWTYADGATITQFPTDRRRSAA